MSYYHYGAVRTPMITTRSFPQSSVFTPKAIDESTLKRLYTPTTRVISARWNGNGYTFIERNNSRDPHAHIHYRGKSESHFSKEEIRDLFRRGVEKVSLYKDSTPYKMEIPLGELPVRNKHQNVLLILFLVALGLIALGAVGYLLFPSLLKAIKIN